MTVLFLGSVNCSIKLLGNNYPVSISVSRTAVNIGSISADYLYPPGKTNNLSLSIGFWVS